MNKIANNNKQAVNALKFIIPYLEKYNFRWVITGGFAARVYGVKRPLTDIDIDIDCSKDDQNFKDFYTDLKKNIKFPLENFVDDNYDNYNFEIEFQGQVIDICPMKEMKVINKETGKYECFYLSGLPEFEWVDFHDLKLPLLAKELIVKNKEMLVFQRDSDFIDIKGLKELMNGSV